MSGALESPGLMRRLFEAKSLEEMSAPTKIIVYTVLALWTIVVLFPLYWVLVTSFKVEVEVDSGPFYIPFVDFKPTLDAWNFMLLQNNTLGPYINSIVVTLLSTVLALIIGALAAYALVRIRFEVKLAAIVTFLVLLVAVIVAVAALHVAWQVAGAVAIALFLLALGTFVRRFKAAVSNNDIEFWMISNRIMPPIVAVLPIYVMFQHLQLLDTQFALIATYTGVNLPIVVWLTRDFFAGVPLDLEESAEIDGASKFRVFFTIALPLVRSGLAATFMLVFILAWNEFLLALFLTNARAQTMPVLVAAQNTTRGPAMVVHVGADRHHDRAGHRHRRLPAEAYCAGPARRRGQGIAPMRVRLENIYKSFGSVEVVKGLNLEVEDGEFLVLLGASGSGKTTALRMIAGLEKVSSGSIRIGDREVTNVLPKYRDIAMVFQSYALYPHMTVFANIAYPLTVRGQPKAEVEAAVKDVARQVQLDMLLDRYPRQLSGGQRQRVALARAMIRRPAAFLMDEPLSNLDAKLRGYMRAELKHMQHQLGITTLYVTHDQIEAMTLAHRVALLEKGVLQQLDTPANMYNAPANLFVAGFIGSPPMNFFDGELAEGRFSGPAGTFGTKMRGSKPRAVAGVRPEDCKVTEPGSGKIVGEVYATELMGDHVLVTCRVDGGAITVKADKSFDRRDGAPIGVDFADASVHLFDKDTGDRLR